MTCIVDFLNSYGRPVSKAAVESIVSAMTNLPEITMICRVRAALDVSNVSLVWMKYQLFIEIELIIYVFIFARRS